MRDYPALEVTWPAPPGDDVRALLLAAVDECAPLAAEDTADGLRVFFDTPAARDRAAALAAQAAPGAMWRAIDVPDEDWAARSQAAITRIRVDRLVVCPPWDVPTRDEVDADALLPVIIRPAMGFGTGHHATTRLCLALLQEAGVAGRRVLDVGTGSGVLALAAWRLGAAAALGIDHDEDALASARDSAGLNGDPESVRFEAIDLEAAAHLPGADVVVANLTGALLCRTAPVLAARTAVSGTLILSGILREEEEDVMRAFAAAGCRVRERRAEDEWVGLWLAATSPSASTAR